MYLLKFRVTQKTLFTKRKKKKNTESAIRKQQIEEVSNLNRTSILQTCKSKQQELIKELIQ